MHCIVRHYVLYSVWILNILANVVGQQNIPCIRNICILCTLFCVLVCYFRLTTEKKPYSRHFLKHFDLFTALWRLPFEHVAVVGFWRRGELRQRRTAAAVCRKKLQISNDSLDYYQS